MHEEGRRLRYDRNNYINLLEFFEGKGKIVRGLVVFLEKALSDFNTAEMSPLFSSSGKYFPQTLSLEYFSSNGDKISESSLQECITVYILHLTVTF